MKSDVAYIPVFYSGLINGGVKQSICYRMSPVYLYLIKSLQTNYPIAKQNHGRVINLYFVRTFSRMEIG